MGISSPWCVEPTLPAFTDGSCQTFSALPQIPGSAARRVPTRRRSLLSRWLVAPATGALPARRMAAKLLEYAAREAVMRAQQGDNHARDLLVGDTVKPVLQKLLGDREPLVWRHAAVARGQVELRIVDVTGRRVRALASGVRAGGAHTVTWDGRDDRGQPVPSGVYFVALTSSGASAFGKLVLLE